MADLKSLRSDLRKTMQEKWAEVDRTPLEAAAGNKGREGTYGHCLYEASRKAVPIKKAYEECAEKHKIASSFRAAWGKG